MVTKAINLADKMSNLRKLIEADDYDARDFFAEVYMLHEYNVSGDRKIGTVECGGFSLETTSALYRLLFLAKPTNVDFSDMYKSSSLFALCSPDGEFVADFQFYKYELAVYCSAVKSHVAGAPSFVQSGMPGSDNGVNANSQELKEWMELLKLCLSRKWMVYGGNDFEV